VIAGPDSLSGEVVCELIGASLKLRVRAARLFVDDVQTIGPLINRLLEDCLPS